MAKKPKKKKFFDVEIPLIKDKTEILAYAPEDLQDKTIKIDMTRRLRGKSLDLVFKIQVEGEKAEAIPKKLRVLPFFIKHMLRKNISYIEDSIKTESKQSNIIVKPFLITRKKVSRAVRKTIRNSARNWIIDYIKTKTDIDLFADILDGKLQKPLSLKLKKIYPLSLCEIRMLEVKNPLEKTTEKSVKKPAKKEAPAKEVKAEPTKKAETKKESTKKKSKK